MNGTYKKSDDQSEGSGSNLAQSLAETASEGGAAAMEKAGEVVDAGKRKLDALKEAFKPYCTEIVEVTTAENFS